jgi:hypothetical protein
MDAGAIPMHSVPAEAGSRDRTRPYARAEIWSRFAHGMARRRSCLGRQLDTDGNTTLSARNYRIYRQTMAAGFYAQVPRDLADCLIQDGFRESGSERGIETLLADSADIATVLVGAHEISQFVEHLWASIRRSKRVPKSGSKVIIERDGRRVAITLEHEGFGDDGPPQAVITGMTALFEALSKPEWRDPQARAPGSDS